MAKVKGRIVQRSDQLKISLTLDQEGLEKDMRAIASAFLGVAQGIRARRIAENKKRRGKRG